VVLTRMGDGGVYSLFLVYSYNLHNPDFKIIGHGCFEVYFFEIQHNALPRYSITHLCALLCDCEYGDVYAVVLLRPRKGRHFLAVEARCP